MHRHMPRIDAGNSLASRIFAAIQQAISAGIRSWYQMMQTDSMSTTGLRHANETFGDGKKERYRPGVAPL